MRVAILHDSGLRMVYRSSRGLAGTTTDTHKHRKAKGAEEGEVALDTIF